MDELADELVDGQYQDQAIQARVPGARESEELSEGGYLVRSARGTRGSRATGPGIIRHVILSAALSAQQLCQRC